MLVVPLVGLGSTVPRLERADGSEPHISLVDPFTAEPDPGTLAELAAFFADVVPFPVRLAGLSEFPGGAPYLSPEPATPFRRIVHELTRRFPELRSTRASFDDAVPHLSVPLREGEDVEALRRALDPFLPVTARAQEAELWRREGDACHTVAHFGFGTSAA